MESRLAVHGELHLTHLAPKGHIGRQSERTESFHVPFLSEIINQLATADGSMSCRGIRLKIQISRPRYQRNGRNR